MSYTGQELMIAFNTQNDKKVWSATARKSPNGADVVHFSTANGMVSLVFDCAAERFTVKFNKFQGAWGDYTKAISRSLYVVLSTLKSAGLAFEAPPSIVGVEIVMTIGDDNSVYVRWPGQQPIMPELARDRDFGFPLPAAFGAPPYGGRLVENIIQAHGYPTDPTQIAAMGVDPVIGEIDTTGK